MATLTTRPDATVTSGSSTATGAASRHAALSDDSDSSYVQMTGATDTVIGFAEPSIPAGGVIKAVALRARIASPGGNASTNILASWGGVWAGFVSSTTLVTITAIPQTAVDASDLSAITATLVWNSDLPGIRLYEVYVDTIYVAQPDLTIDSFSGGVVITDDNAPAIEWTPDLDTDGGEQTAYEIRVMLDGEDPDTDTPVVQSGVLTGNATSWDMSDIDGTLANDTYNACVRIAQTVNGDPVWSDWATSDDFIINVPLPTVPTLSVAGDDATGRINITATAQTGVVTTDLIQIQRSDDAGTTYANIRTRLGGGIIDPDVDTAPFDRESSNGETAYYRVRAIHNYTDTIAYSDWSSADSDDWTSTAWFLRHPSKPALDMAVVPRSQPSRQRAARQGTFKVLGRSDPIVISDVREYATGEIVFRLDTKAERDDLDALLDEMVPLLLQAPSTDDWEDAWLSFGDQNEERVIDNAAYEGRFTTLPFSEVIAPTDNLESWT